MHAEENRPRALGNSERELNEGGRGRWGPVGIWRDRMMGAHVEGEVEWLPLNAGKLTRGSGDQRPRLRVASRAPSDDARWSEDRVRPNLKEWMERSGFSGDVNVNVNVANKGLREREKETGDWKGCILSV